MTLKRAVLPSQRMPGMTMGMGCAKSLSIPGKVSGHCLGLGLDPTEVSRNSSCLCSSLSLHGCISSELQLKPDCLPYFSFSYPLDSQREPKSLGYGAVYRPETSLTWQRTLAGLQAQGFLLHVGGSTALYLQGLGHFICL